jgi:uncharacterized protein (TIGR02271 family)
MPDNDSGDTSGNLRIPLMEERLEAHVRKRQEQVVRLTKRVETEPVEAEIDIHTDEVDVERVPRNEAVSGPRAPWHEGDTLIAPVYEERLVVEKRLVLTEEIHIRRTVKTAQVEVKETVRRETVDIDNEEVSGDTP